METKARYKSAHRTLFKREVRDKKRLRLFNLIVLMLLILFPHVNVISQSTDGMIGLINIPSGRMLNDGEIILGASLIPKPFFKSTSGLNFLRNTSNGLNTYVSFGILPFVEVMFRYTHELGAKVNIETRYFPDRMFGFKMRILNEKRLLPSVVIGLNDLSSVLGTTCDTCSYFNSSYLVGSKKLNSSVGYFDFTLGYAFNFKNFMSKHIRGFFTGISYRPIFFDRVNIILENDSKSINTAFNFNFLGKSNLLIGLRDLEKMTMGLNFNF